MGCSDCSFFFIRFIEIVPTSWDVNGLDPEWNHGDLVLDLFFYGMDPDPLGSYVLDLDLTATVKTKI